MQVTLELEKRIKFAKESPDIPSQLEKIEILQNKKNSEFEFVVSEKEYFRGRNIDLELEILKLNSEKLDFKQVFNRLEKERDNWKKTLLDVYLKITGRPTENESPLSIFNHIISFLDSQKDKKSSGLYEKAQGEINYLRKQLEYYQNMPDFHGLQQENKRLEESLQNLKLKEANLQNKIEELQSRSGDSFLSALYEEKKLREELEEELTEKCNLIESILKEFEENKKYLKL